MYRMCLENYKDKEGVKESRMVYKKVNGLTSSFFRFRKRT